MSTPMRRISDGLNIYSSVSSSLLNPGVRGTSKSSPEHCGRQGQQQHAFKCSQVRKAWMCGHTGELVQTQVCHVQHDELVTSCEVVSGGIFTFCSPGILSVSQQQPEA